MIGRARDVNCEQSGRIEKEKLENNICFLKYSCIVNNESNDNYGATILSQIEVFPKIRMLEPFIAHYYMPLAPYVNPKAVYREILDPMKEIKHQYLEKLIALYSVRLSVL